MNTATDLVLYMILFAIYYRNERGREMLNLVKNLIEITPTMSSVHSKLLWSSFKISMYTFWAFHMLMPDIIVSRVTGVRLLWRLSKQMMMPNLVCIYCVEQTGATVPAFKFTRIIDALVFVWNCISMFLYISLNLQSFTKLLPLSPSFFGLGTQAKEGKK